MAAEFAGLHHKMEGPYQVKRKPLPLPKDGSYIRGHSQSPTMERSPAGNFILTLNLPSAINMDDPLPQSSPEDNNRSEGIDRRDHQPNVPIPMQQSVPGNNNRAEANDTRGYQPNSPVSIQDSTCSTETITPKRMELEWEAQSQEILIMVSLAIITLAVALDATIVVTALPTIARDLHGSAVDAFWAGTSYLLSCAIFQPFIGSLSEIFGRQQLLIPSLTLFTVGCIIAGVANDFTTLLVGRLIQGVGGGGIITLAQVIFTDIVPLRYRPKWWTIIQASWALGTVIGPLIGGLFVQHSTWRWIFWINFPFCGIGFVMVPLVLRLRTKKTSFTEKLFRVDWIGGTIFIASLTSFLIAISWGGIQYSWSSWRTLVPMLIGGAGLIGALEWEWYVATEPFLRRSLFYNWSARASYICAVTQGLLLFSQLYYVPLYFASAKGKTPTEAGLGLLPATCALVPGGIIVGRVITRIGHWRWAVFSGWAITTLATGLLIMFDTNTNTATWASILVVLGIGHGLVLTSLTFSTQAICKDGDAAFAAAMYAFTRTLGMTLGVAIGGSVFQNLMRRKLENSGLPAEIAKNAEGYLATLRALPSSSPLKHGVQLAYVKGYQGVFEVMTAISVAALLLSLLIKSYPLDRELDSHHVLRKIEESRSDIEEGKRNPGR